MSKVNKRVRAQIGEVISDRSDKTVVVLVERKVPHLKYKKYIKRSSKMHAHDQDNHCKVGDIVKIQETRPRSKMKTWEVVEIVSHNDRRVS